MRCPEGAAFVRLEVHKGPTEEGQRDSFLFLAEIGFPLPIRVIGEMLGVPEPERAQFRQLVGDVTGILELSPTPEQNRLCSRPSRKRPSPTTTNKNPTMIWPPSGILLPMTNH